jgi:hypothetical protein
VALHAQLKGLTNLPKLLLGSTNVTDAGLVELKGRLSDKRRSVSWRL